MLLFWVVLLVLLLVFFLALYMVYRICFLEYRVSFEEELIRDAAKKEEFHGYYDVVRRGMLSVAEEKNYETVQVLSHDGLKLYGRYYHRGNGAPLIIFMHGYHGNFYRDGMGIFGLSKRYGYNLLLIHERAHGLSEGKTITFGVKERLDCKTWVEYAVKRFGTEQKILISGLSMGAATVMMAANVGLPTQVKGIMADCGFSSPKEIICEVMHQIKYPVKLMYPLAKLSARVFGGFDLEGEAALKSMKECQLPILFIHGEADDFVPTRMSVACHEVCTSEKELLLVPGAGHGMSYCYQAKEYEEAVDRLFQKAFCEN